jgi:type III protein arginine methyltransferase
MEALQDAISKAKWKEIVALSAVFVSGGDDGDDGDDDDQRKQAQQQQEIALSSCLDEENGGVQWNPISNGATTENQSTLLSHYLQTKPWIIPMLNDTKRNELYFKAIERAVAKLRAKTSTAASCASSPVATTWNVLDIGCGTGLLGMMAAKQILSSSCQENERADSLHVSMVDMSSEMVELARQTLADNNQLLNESFMVKVQCGHSCEIPPLFSAQHFEDRRKQQQSNIGTSGPASIANCSNDLQPQTNGRIINTLIVSELLESGLLGEGWLPAVRDALQRHVHPKSRTDGTVVVVPQAATVYVAALEGDWIRSYSGPHATINSSSQTPVMLRAGRGTMLPLHADKLLRDGRLRLLSDPLAVFGFHVMDGNNSRESQKQVQLPITCSGRIDGILVWWTLTLYDDDDDNGAAGGALVYSMTPHSILKEDQQQPWQDHWHQCLHLVEPSTVVEAGDVQPLVVMHDDSCIYVEFSSEKTPERAPTAATTKTAAKNLDEEPPAAKRPCLQADNSASSTTTCTCTCIQEIKSHSQLISPARAYQLNDVDRMNLLRRAIGKAVANYSSNADLNDTDHVHEMAVLDLSDSSLCAIIAAQAGAQNIYSLESSTNSSSQGNNTLEICRIMAQMAQCTTEIKILPCHAEQLTLDLFRSESSNNNGESFKTSTSIDLCVAEPYYEVMEDWPLIQALNLYFMTRSLRKRGILTDRTIMLPGTVRLVGCAIESKQLYSAYRPCGDDDEVSDNSSMIHGIRHRVINRLLSQYHSSDYDGVNKDDDTKHRFQYDLSLPMWQYDCTRLTPPVELARLSYNEPSAEASVQTTSRVPFFNRSGVCHAMMVWVEYDFNSNSNGAIPPPGEKSNRQEAKGGEEEDLPMTISTDNQSYRQLVQMLEPMVIRKNDYQDGQGGDECQNQLNEALELVCTCTIGGLQGGQTHRLDVQIKGRETEDEKHLNS